MTRPDPSSRASGFRRGWYAAAGTGALLTGALGYVALVDPHNVHTAYPRCPFKWLTGWDCPFCGGLRMTHDLLHGNLMAAVGDNVFLLALIPMLAGWIAFRRRRGEALLPVRATLAIAAAAVVWTVVRNLPGFPLIPMVVGG